MEIISVILASSASFAIGGVYYSLLSKPWLEATGQTMESIQNAEKKPWYLSPMLIAFVVSIMAAGMLRHILTMAGIEHAAKGGLVGFGIGFFIVGGWIVLNNSFESKPMKLSAINTGYATLSLTVQGILLTML